MIYIYINNNVESAAKIWGDNVQSTNVSNAYYNSAKNGLSDYLKSSIYLKKFGYDFSTSKVNIGRFIDGDTQTINYNELIDAIAAELSIPDMITMITFKSTLDSDLRKKCPEIDYKPDEDVILLNTEKAKKAMISYLLDDIYFGKVQDIDAYIDLLNIIANGDKEYWRSIAGITGGIYDGTTSAQIKKTAFYEMYVNKIMVPGVLEHQISDFLNGNDEGFVYCVQDKDSFDKFVLGNGNLGRTEGYYAISEEAMLNALNKASKDYDFKNADDIQKFLTGTISCKLDFDYLCELLQLPSNIFDNGAAIVKAPATKDSLRASLVTDVGANVMYTPGFHTPFVSELVNEQITGLNMTNIGTNSYRDLSKQVYAVVLEKK